MLAVIQMSSTNKKTENLEKIKELVSKAAEDGAKVQNFIRQFIYKPLSRWSFYPRRQTSLQPQGMRH